MMQKKGDMGRCPIREKIIAWQKIFVVSDQVCLGCAIIKQHTNVKARHCRPRTSSPPTPTRLRLRLLRCVNFDRSKTTLPSSFGGVMISTRAGYPRPVCFVYSVCRRVKRKQSVILFLRKYISVIYLIRKIKKLQVFGLNHNLKKREKKT